jgi:hypothetical protein
MKFAFVFLLTAALFGCRAERQHYFVFIGDRSTPAYDQVAVGMKISRLMVFSNSGGQSIMVRWHGDNPSHFDGSGAIVSTRPHGRLSITAQVKRDMIMYIVRGKADGSEGVVIDKRIIRPGSVFSYENDMR